MEVIRRRDAPGKCAFCYLTDVFVYIKTYFYS